MPSRGSTAPFLRPLHKILGKPSLDETLPMLRRVRCYRFRSRNRDFTGAHRGVHEHLQQRRVRRKERSRRPRDRTQVHTADRDHQSTLQSCFRLRLTRPRCLLTGIRLETVDHRLEVLDQFASAPETHGRRVLRQKTPNAPEDMDDPLAVEPLCHALRKRKTYARNRPRQGARASPWRGVRGSRCRVVNRRNRRTLRGSTRSGHCHRGVP